MPIKRQVSCFSTDVSHTTAVTRSRGGGGDGGGDDGDDMTEQKVKSVAVTGRDKITRRWPVAMATRCLHSE